MNDIYSEVILDHYQNPRNKGVINNPSYQVLVVNYLCGDKLNLFIKINSKGIIKDIKFLPSGCAISIATMSMLTEYLKGKHKDELKKINKDFIIKMLGIKLGVNRLKCALLSLEAIKKIIHEK